MTFLMYTNTDQSVEGLGLRRTQRLANQRMLWYRFFTIMGQSQELLGLRCSTK